MNTRKCFRIVKEFQDRAAFYQTQFQDKEPSVDDLRDMKKEYVIIGIELNKAIAEPDIQKTNVEDLLGAAKKANVNKSDLNIEDIVSEPEKEFMAQPKREREMFILRMVRDFAIAATILGTVSLGYYAGSRDKKVLKDWYMNNIHVPKVVPIYPPVIRPGRGKYTVVTPNPVPTPVPKPVTKPVVQPTPPTYPVVDHYSQYSNNQLIQAEQDKKYRNRHKPRFFRSIGQGLNDIGSAVTLGAIPNYDGEKVRGVKRIGKSFKRLFRGVARIPYGAVNSTEAVLTGKDRDLKRQRRNYRRR